MNGDREPNGDPAWWDAWRGVIFTHARVFDAVEAPLRERSGISLVFLDVLGRLCDAPERRLRIQELQERSLFTKSGMTRLVDRMAEAGLVRREPVPGDRRGVYVVVTDEGAATYERGIAGHQEDIEREFASRLTPEQQRAVADALRGFWQDEDEAGPETAG
jgi:DNA-binding MarR family transcriptional regulator